MNHSWLMAVRGELVASCGGAESVFIDVDMLQIHSGSAPDDPDLLRCARLTLCLGPVKCTLRANPFGGYDGYLDVDPEFGFAHLDAPLDRAVDYVGQALAAAAALRADAVGASGGGQLPWVVAASSAHTNCSTDCLASGHCLRDAATTSPIPSPPQQAFSLFLAAALSQSGAHSVHTARVFDAMQQRYITNLTSASWMVVVLLGSSATKANVERKVFVEMSVQNTVLLEPLHAIEMSRHARLHLRQQSEAILSCWNVGHTGCNRELPVHKSSQGTSLFLSEASKLKWTWLMVNFLWSWNFHNASSQCCKCREYICVADTVPNTISPSLLFGINGDGNNLRTFSNGYTAHVFLNTPSSMMITGSMTFKLSERCPVAELIRWLYFNSECTVARPLFLFHISIANSKMTVTTNSLSLAHVAESSRLQQSLDGRGLTGCIMCLLKASADANIPDEDGPLPVHIAATWSMDGIIQNANTNFAIIYIDMMAWLGLNLTSVVVFGKYLTSTSSQISSTASTLNISETEVVAKLQQPWPPPEILHAKINKELVETCSVASNLPSSTGDHV